MLKRKPINIGDANNRIKTAIALSAGALTRSGKSPDEVYGDLFKRVQGDKLLGDGKAFTDLVPKSRVRAIMQEYKIEKRDPNFNLREFINRHFYEFNPHKSDTKYVPSPDADISDHIDSLWSVLKRRNRRNRGSLVSLPHSYVVPGGRFNEQYYWDTYFIMLGLACSDRWRDIDRMMKNYSYMIRKFGFIPTANRTYYLSRSQPPMFSHMIKLLAKKKGKKRTYLEYLPYLLTEYNWWMRGQRRLSKQEHRAFARVAEMPNRTILNRYYDNKATPRPESLFEDVETANHAEGRQADRLYLHLRAGAESGWDFSSRWMLDPYDIKTIHTADIIPVDLNCLMYDMEVILADSYAIVKNSYLEKKFRILAKKRAEAINTYCWSNNREHYVDYNFHHFHETNGASLAMVYPLYSGIANDYQAQMVARKIREDFLVAGGVVTSLVNSGQQWDAPNGWAPLQWLTIVGLKRYGFNDLANDIKKRWLDLNSSVYEKERKLVEKYNVYGNGGLGGGGEYPLQDGFGWTNGVFSALMHNLDDQEW